MTKKHRGILLVVLGVVMVLAGLGLHVMNEKQDAMAGRNSEILLRELNYEIKFNDDFLKPSETPDVVETPPKVQEQPNLPLPDRTVGGKKETMPVKTLSGYNLIGILQLPSLGLELPVLDQWNYSLLTVAPCRYSGSLEGGDLILLGHDYKSHFQALRSIAVGDTVMFSDVNGTVYHYRVAVVEQIHESDAQLLGSEHPLILFTCTRDGNHRIVVRCEKN